MGNNWLKTFGFSKNPYDTRALTSKEGDALLVGRERETQWLLNQLTTTSRIPLLTGDNGVGKSSIVNVVAYRMNRQFSEGNVRYFSIEPREIWSVQFDDLDKFEKNIYREILYFLLRNKQFLRKRGIGYLETRDVNNYIRKLMHTSAGGGIGAFSASVSFSRGVNPNPSAEAYMAQVARDWLNKCFSEPYGGGIVCLIDNLENCGTAGQVQKVLESLRDTLFNIPGLLCVLCGTPNALEGALTSRRLDGYIAPCEIDPVSDESAHALVTRRLTYFGGENADPPVNPALFKYLYTNVVNCQLRSAFALCEDFSQHLYQYPDRRGLDRFEELKQWLHEISADLPPKEREIPELSWRLFDFITDLGCDFMSSSYRLFNAPSEEELDEIAFPLVRQLLLERVNLDDGFLLRVTRDGWLVRYRRQN